MAYASGIILESYFGSQSESWDPENGIFGASAEDSISIVS
jgi:hypothetical protein